MHSTLVKIHIVFCLTLNGLPSRAQQTLMPPRLANGEDRLCTDTPRATSDKRRSCVVRVASDGVPLSPFKAKPPAAETAHNDELPKTHTAGSAFGIVRSSVNVEAPHTKQDSNEGFERRITMDEIKTSAGTFGDPSRFIQMLPGVVSDNDQRNDFLVRGGNPSENLFVIDNIEIPSD